MSERRSADEIADELDAEIDDRNHKDSLNKPPQVTDEDYDKYSKQILSEMFRRERANAIQLSKNLRDWIGKLSLEPEEFEDNDEAAVDSRFELVAGLASDVNKALNRLKAACLLHTAAADLDQ